MLLAWNVGVGPLVAVLSFVSAHRLGCGARDRVDYTTFLNIAFAAVAVALVWLTLRRGARDRCAG